MKCPECGGGNIYVANTYSGGAEGGTQRRVCDDCGAVLVCVTRLIEVNPPRGRGASSLAKRMKKASEEARKRED